MQAGVKERVKANGDACAGVCPGGQVEEGSRSRGRCKAGADSVQGVLWRPKLRERMRMLKRGGTSREVDAPLNAWFLGGIAQAQAQVCDCSS